MKKIRDGIGGELTAEIFETWFPDNPEQILRNFLGSGKERMICGVRLNEKDVGISHITIDYAMKLLDEFKILRGK